MMASAEKTVRIVPSILDRLIDEDPADQAPGRPQEHLHPGALRASVRRDLEELLNSRVSWLTWPKAYKELDLSLLRYGLPDFSTMPVSSQDARAHLCRIVEQTIRTFEPRFADIRVSVLEEPEATTTLKLRISAVMYAVPRPEEVSFDTELEPVTLGLRLVGRG